MTDEPRLQTLDVRSYWALGLRRLAQERALGALGGLVLASVAVRIWLAWKIPGPWIFSDELSYSDLARSVATGEGFRIRGVPTTGLGILYPAVISPAWFVQDAMSAYVIAKAINVVLAISVAIPIFFWARRLVPVAHALLACSLVLLLPGLLYAGNLMTESAFITPFVLAALAIALALERPTLVRQGLALSAIVLACLVRLQGVVLVLVLASAVVLEALLAARAERPLRPGRFVLGRIGSFWPSAVGLGLAVSVYVVVKAIQGAELSSGLGAYRVTAESEGYSAGSALRWVVYHLADLPLSVGMLPASALIVLLGLALLGRVGTTPAERAFLAVTATAVWWVAIEVGVFTSRFAGRISERSLFFVTPLLLLALVVWIARGLPRPWWLALPAVLGPGALLFTIPFAPLLGLQILYDSFGLVPYKRLSTIVGGVDDVRLLIGAGVIAAAVLFALAPRRLAARAVPAAVALYLALTSYAAFGHTRDYATLLNNVSGGTTDASWVDDEIGSDADAAYLYATTLDPENSFVNWVTLWHTEFWNRSIESVYYVGEPDPSGLPQTGLTIDQTTGTLKPVPASSAASSGARPSARYVVADARLIVAGEVLATRGKYALFRVAPPLGLAGLTQGVWGDAWMGEDAAYTYYRAADPGPGRIEIFLSRLSAELSRFTGIQDELPARAVIRVGTLVTGPDGGPQMGEVRAVRTLDIRAQRDELLTIATPAPPFRVEVHIAPTFAPADYGIPDTRALGARISFSYRPGGP